jgi:uncharacterized linocin/CFP29 family protein
MPANPQVPWTDEQWAQVNQVVQEEGRRARVAGSFLPLSGPLSDDADFIREELVNVAPAVPPLGGAPGVPGSIRVNDTTTRRLTKLQARVHLRGSQLADPNLTSALQAFRRAAIAVARTEDALILLGETGSAAGGLSTLGPGPVGAAAYGAAQVAIAGALGGAAPAQARLNAAAAAATAIAAVNPTELRGGEMAVGVYVRGQPLALVAGPDLVATVANGVFALENNGHAKPYALVLGQALFQLATTPAGAGLVMPLERIAPFLGGGSVHPSPTLPPNAGVLIALGGAPIELVVAKDMAVDFLHVTDEPLYLFRVSEKIAVRVKEPGAILSI